jgi:hypothetical protein
MHNRHWVGRNRGKTSIAVTLERVKIEVNKNKTESGAKHSKRRFSKTSLSLTLVGIFRAPPTKFLRFSAVFKRKIVILLIFFSALNVPFSFGSTNLTGFGALYDHFQLTLSPGDCTEISGPLFYIENSATSSLFALPPLFSLYKDPGIAQTEWELGYPILTFDRFGKEYRFQFCQVIAWSGGEAMKTGGEKKRVTIFPLYFQQRGPDPKDNYTALLPIYGHLRNHFFRDEIFFVLLPGYLQSVKKGMVTDNFLFPFFHLRHGAGIKGWQFWPVIGEEHKQITTSTNVWGDIETIPGHEKFFTLWPFFFKNTLGIGSTNLQKQFVLIPFYTSQVSTSRVSKSYGFPIGYTHTVDHEKQYEEHDAPWPLIEFAHGPGKQASRVWPFYGKAKNETLENNFYLWPVYKFNAIHADPLDRERTRILLFLYSDLSERNTTNNTVFRWRDFWPLYTWRKDRNENTRLQVLALLEPLLPGNKNIERVYSPIYSLWRQEHNPKDQCSSKSLLWNLYRSEVRPDYIRQSACFGLFHRERTGTRTHWRLFFVPFNTGEKKDSE